MPIPANRLHQERSESDAFSELCRALATPVCLYNENDMDPKSLLLITISSQQLLHPGRLLPGPELIFHERWESSRLQSLNATGEHIAMLSESIEAQSGEPI
jgi:hypothetical protein